MLHMISLPAARGVLSYSIIEEFTWCAFIAYLEPGSWVIHIRYAYFNVCSEVTLT